MLFNQIALKLKIRKYKFKLKKIYHLLIILLLTVIFYCEFVVYYTQTLKWPHLQCEKDMNCVRVLFVADPQIIGKLNEPQWYGSISRWDCARYLGTTYSIAINFFRPDIVIFLGDLLDEGYVASMADFEEYVHIFNQVFPRNNYMKYIYTYGDNDIGEESSPVRHLYNSVFNKNETYIYHYNNLEIVDISLTQKIFKLTYHTQMIITHDISDDLAKQFFLKYAPSIQLAVIFAGHIHNSTIRNFVGNKDGLYVKHVRELRGFNIFEGNLNEMHCINVPTCSYRMGVPKMGFGAATFVPNEVHFNYTILWSPPRFPILTFYFIIMAILFIVITINYCTLFSIHYFKMFK